MESKGKQGKSLPHKEDEYKSDDDDESDDIESISSIALRKKQLAGNYNGNNEYDEIRRSNISQSSSSS